MSRRLILAGCFLVAAFLVIPYQADAQDCYNRSSCGFWFKCVSGQSVEEDDPNFTCFGGNCAGPNCPVNDNDSALEMQERAEFAWKAARVERLSLSGYVLTVALEVPPSLPPVELVDGWVASARAQCEQRRSELKLADEPDPSESGS